MTDANSTTSNDVDIRQVIFDALRDKGWEKSFLDELVDSLKVATSQNAPGSIVTLVALYVGDGMGEGWIVFGDWNQNGEGSPSWNDVKKKLKLFGPIETGKGIKVGWAVKKVFEKLNCKIFSEVVAERQNRV